MSDLKDLERMLNKVSKNSKFGFAGALTKVVREIQAQEKKNIQNTFESPTPFTVNSVKSIGARRDNLEAKVFIQDIATQYLAPYEFGGVRMLNSQVLLNPKNVPLNKYGNLPRTKTKILLAKDDVFSETIQTKHGEISGIWQRKKRKVVSRGRKRKAGNNQRDSLKLLIRFGKALPVQQDLGFYDVAQQTISRELPIAMKEALSNAFATAK